ncbi:shikimate kinase AroK [soil metagenome]
MFLVGPMGAGKTAVGRQLARRLRYQFCDSDLEVEARAGADISLIFEKEGEAGFRRREKEAIDRLTQRAHVVLATGGGAILDPDNRGRLASRGYVIYLSASIDRQLERTSRSDRRPLLHTENPKAALDRLMHERDPLYRAVADSVIDTDGRLVAVIAAQLHELCERSGLAL